MDQCGILSEHCDHNSLPLSNSSWLQLLHQRQNSSFIYLSSHCGLSPNLATMALSGPHCGSNSLRVPETPAGSSKACSCEVTTCCDTLSSGWHLSAERLQTIHALGILKWLGNTAYAPKCCISAEWSRKTLVTSDKLCFSKINLYSSHTGKKLTPPPGNQTQVTRMAIMHDITKPVMQICWVKLKIIVLLCNNQKTIKFHHTHIGSIFAAPLITVLQSQSRMSHF